LNHVLNRDNPLWTSSDAVWTIVLTTYETIQIRHGISALKKHNEAALK
jgi:hypothetical protein